MEGDKNMWLPNVRGEQNGAEAAPGLVFVLDLLGDVYYTTFLL